VPVLEDSLSLPQPIAVRKRLKKQLVWLKRRLGETTRQEKSILTRLGQLSWEIQSRERLLQVENERKWANMVYRGNSLKQVFALNATSPAFRPLCPHPPTQQEWVPMSNHGQGPCHVPKSGIVATIQPQSPVRESNDTFAQQSISHGLSISSDESEEREWASRVMRSASVPEVLLAVSEKRLSMPILKTIWQNLSNPVSEDVQ
jgi:hypothetical protein